MPGRFSNQALQAMGYRICLSFRVRISSANLSFLVLLRSKDFDKYTAKSSD